MIESEPYWRQLNVIDSSIQPFVLKDVFHLLVAPFPWIPMFLEFDQAVQKKCIFKFPPQFKSTILINFSYGIFFCEIFLPLDGFIYEYMVDEFRMNSINSYEKTRPSRLK